jgi:nicotinamide-nucleotide amidase
MNTLAKEIGDLLKEHHLTLGVIESATGGLISSLITDVSGSSDYYRGSITSYSNEIKTGLVGVREETLQKYGAVSSRVAEEMAAGGRKVLGVDICVADTGVAGPTGATTGKPLGLFYLGLSHKGGTFNRKHLFKGDREQNKQQAALTALNWLKEYLLSLNPAISQDIENKQVVTAFLRQGNKILILRRSGKVGTYRGKWAGVSGYIEKTAREQALSEIQEETGLSPEDVKLVREGSPLEVLDAGLKIKWIIHPFLFEVKNPEKIKTDWEHQEARWISPADIDHYDTVPKLKEALNTVIES